MPNYNPANVPNQPPAIWADIIARDWERAIGSKPLSIHWIVGHDAICLLDSHGVPYFFDIAESDNTPEMLWRSEFADDDYIIIPYSNAFLHLNDDPSHWDSVAATLDDLPND